MSDPTPARLRSLFRDLRALDIDKGKAAWLILDRASILTTRAGTARAAADTAWNRAVAELVKTADITDAARADLALYSDANAADRDGERIVDRAVRTAYAVLMRDAENAARPEAPAMFAALVKTADAAVRTIERAGVPAGLHDEAALLRAGVSPQAWDAVTAAADRFQTAHSAYATLRDLGWLPQHRDEWHRYKRADLVHPTTRTRVLAAAEAFTLVYAITAGAEPGMYDAATARDNQAQAAKQAANLKGAKR